MSSRANCERPSTCCNSTGPSDSLCRAMFSRWQAYRGNGTHQARPRCRGADRRPPVARRIMMDPTEIIQSQADAARNILQDHGPEKAMGYLIGEKFLNFLEVA